MIARHGDPFRAHERERGHPRRHEQPSLAFRRVWHLLSARKGPVQKISNITVNIHFRCLKARAKPKARSKSLASVSRAVG